MCTNVRENSLHVNDVDEVAHGPGGADALLHALQMGVGLCVRNMPLDRLHNTLCLPGPGGLCRSTHRNGRSASRIRTAAQIAHCSVGATAPNSTVDSGLSRMSIGGHSKRAKVNQWH